MLRVLVLVSLLACGETPPPPVKAPVVTAKRTEVTPRSKLPTAIQKLLPVHGVYIAGGGTMSTAWRVIVDYDKKTVYGGTAGKSSPSYGAMAKEATNPLSPRNEVHLARVAEDVWREEPPKEQVDPTADYDEIFVVLDGDDAFFLQGFGPIRRPVAAQAIIEFRAAAGL